MSPDVQTELRRLLSALFDGELDEAGRARLGSLLAGDADARRLYLEYADLHARLLTRDAPPAVPAPVTAPARERPARRTPYALVAVVTLALSLLAQLLLPIRPPRADDSRPPAGAPAAVSSPDYVATLSPATGCEWEEAGESLRPGVRLAPGEYRLRAGVARFRFDGGTSLFLQGPATLRLESPTGATLAAGRAVFSDDEAAPGFELRTPLATLTDVGTEYAVAVGPDGEEVHVFDGAVNRTPRTADPRPERIAAGQARRYGPDPAAGEVIRLDPARFARRLPPQPLPPPDPLAGLLAYEGFAYTDPAALQAGAADGGTGWAGPWRPGLARPANPAGGTNALNVSEGLARPGASVRPVGGCFDFTGFAKYYRRMKTPVRLDADGLYYVSFLVRRHGPPADPLNAVAILFRTTEELERDERGGADPRSRLNIGIDRTNDVFTHLNRRGSRVPLPLSSGETYLVAAKVVASREHPDQVFVRVYGPDEAADRDEPGAWSLSGRPVGSDLVFDWLEVHINSKTRQSIDEIRVGTTWAAVSACWTTAGRNPP
jgi:ferric-dicitrate binding protein FerR (iron transport regulator)